MKNVQTGEKWDIKSLFHAERHCQKDRITILILSFSPQLISLHNVLVTECIVGDFFHADFFAEIESSKTPCSFPFSISSVGPSNHLPSQFHPISPYLLVPFLPTNLPPFLLLLTSLFLFFLQNPSVILHFFSLFPSAKGHLLQRAGEAPSGNSTLALKMVLWWGCT